MHTSDRASSSQHSLQNESRKRVRAKLKQAEQRYGATEVKNLLPPIRPASTKECSMELVSFHSCSCITHWRRLLLAKAFRLKKLGDNIELAQDQKSRGTVAA